MRCRSCMTINPVGNRYCERCGAHFHASCVNCGHDVSPCAHYCGTCGRATRGARSAHAPQWGELKQATVLFADIVGSTELVARLDPEQAMARLRPAVLRMRHSVERFGGTVARTLGDGVMAFFGVPCTLEGHAMLGCRAALHMQEAFRHAGDGLAIRIGLHSGEVVSDPEDAEDGRGGGAHGLTIHLASRVTALAPAQGILITAACHAAAGCAGQAIPLGLRELKGVPEPVELLSLSRIEPAAADVARTGVQPAVFRGRARELTHLLDRLDQVGQGSVNTIAIEGEPGVGKSRLCQEFLRWCDAHGVPFAQVRAQPYGHALPLQPILDLLRGHFLGVGAGEPPGVVRARVASMLAPLRMPPGELDLDLACACLGTPSPSSGAAAPGVALLTSTACLSGLLQALVRVQTGPRRVILIEDLQWLDAGSAACVAALVRAVAGTSTLLLLNYREAPRSCWAALPAFERLRLEGVPRADMRALVAELLGPSSRGAAVRTAVCRCTRGNPYFAQELVRTLAGASLPAALPPGRFAAAIEQAMPASVRAIIGARLDRLEDDEKALLQLCAIIGKEVPMALLEAVADRPPEVLQARLAALCRAGLVVVDRRGRRLTFCHPLIQAVAYGSQLKAHRARVHARVASAMDRLYADRMDELAGRIAYHYEQAGDPLTAARCRARERRRTASMDVPAVRRWLEHVGRLGATPA